MQSIAETCVRFDAAHLSINLVLEIAVPMFPTLSEYITHSTWYTSNPDKYDHCSHMTFLEGAFVYTALH